MFKKLTLSCMAVVAFAAFVLPATASAANKPTLVEGATVVKVGSTIKATNIGNAIFWNTATSSKQVTCTESTMTGTVVANANDTVEGNITKATFSGPNAVNPHNGLKECEAAIGSAYVTVTTPLCIRSTAGMATDEFQVTGNKCGEAEKKVIFTIGPTGLTPCKYESTGPVKGTFTTNS